MAGGGEALGGGAKQKRGKAGKRKGAKASWFQNGYDAPGGYHIPAANILHADNIHDYTTNHGDVCSA